MVMTYAFTAGGEKAKAVKKAAAASTERIRDYATAAGYLRPNTDRITGERHAYLMSG